MVLTAYVPATEETLRSIGSGYVPPSRIYAHASNIAARKKRPLPFITLVRAPRTSTHQLVIRLSQIYKFQESAVMPVVRRYSQHIISNGHPFKALCQPSTPQCTSTFPRYSQSYTSTRASHHQTIAPTPQAPPPRTPIRQSHLHLPPSRLRSSPPLRNSNPSAHFTTTPTRPTNPPPPPAPHTTTPTPLTIEEFHRLSDTYIDTLVARLEELQEAREEVDVEYSAGVLTLLLPPQGTFVLNKQPPNKQIWLSSPISGPKRYDWVADEDEDDDADEGGGGGKWTYLRDGSTLDALLAEEIGVKMDGEAAG